MGECEVFLDTSVIVAAYLSRRVRGVIEALGRHCELLYSAYYTVVDIDGSELDEAVKAGTKRWAANNLKDAGYLSVAVESQVFGRYGRWVKRIKKMDVAIAYLALEGDYIFATGDWQQLLFYNSLYSSRNPKKLVKAMFIPVRWLG